jgi:hypothetical protein
MWNHHTMGGNIMERHLYLTRSRSGPLCCANSFFDALELAYKLSAHTSSPLLAPSEIECLNTGQRFDATDRLFGPT